MGSAVIVEDNDMFHADLKASKTHQECREIKHASKMDNNDAGYGLHDNLAPVDNSAFAPTTSPGNEARRPDISGRAHRESELTEPTIEHKGHDRVDTGGTGNGYPGRSVEVAATTSLYSADDSLRLSNANSSSSQDSSRHRNRNRNGSVDNGTCTEHANARTRRAATDEPRPRDSTRNRPAEGDRRQERDRDRREATRDSNKERESDKDSRYRRDASHASYSHTASDKDYSTKRKRSPSPYSRPTYRRSPRRQRSSTPPRYGIRPRSPLRPHGPGRPHSPFYRRLHSPPRGYLPPPDRAPPPPYRGRGPSLGPPPRYAGKNVSPPRRPIYPDEQWGPSPPYRGRGPPPFGDRSPPRGPPIYLDGPGYDRRRPPPPDPRFAYSPPRRPPLLLSRRGPPSSRPPPGYPSYDRRGPHYPSLSRRSPPPGRPASPYGYRPRSPRHEVYPRRPWTPSPDRGPPPPNSTAQYSARERWPANGVDSHRPADHRQKEWSARSGWDVPPSIPSGRAGDARVEPQGNGVRRWNNGVSECHSGERFKAHGMSRVRSNSPPQQIPAIANGTPPAAATALPAPELASVPDPQQQNGIALDGAEDQQPSVAGCTAAPQDPAPNDPATCEKAAANARRGIVPDQRCWYYMDPLGRTQGPCSITQFHGWINALSTDSKLVREYEQFKTVTVWREGLTVRLPLIILLNARQSPPGTPLADEAPPPLGETGGGLT